MSNTFLAQAIAFPFALVAGLLANAWAQGWASGRYGNYLERLYDLEAKAPIGSPEKQFFAQQAAEQASWLMGRQVRHAKFVGALVFIYIIYFVVCPELTTAIAEGWFEGYRRGSGRDAPILEVMIATVFGFALLGAAWASLDVLGRHYWRAWQRLNLGSKLTRLWVLGTAVVVLVLVRLIVIAVR